MAFSGLGIWIRQPIGCLGADRARSVRASNFRLVRGEAPRGNAKYICNDTNSLLCKYSKHQNVGL